MLPPVWLHVHMSLPALWTTPDSFHLFGAAQTPRWMKADAAKQDGWWQWLQSPSRRAGADVCGFGPFLFHLLFHRSLASPVGSPFGHPKQRKPTEWLAVSLCPVSSRLITAAADPTLLPVPPHGTAWSPCLVCGVFLTLQSSEMQYFLFCSSFFLLASHAGLRPGSFEELQHINISQGGGVRAKRQRSPPWSYLERRGKENGTCIVNQRERGRDRLADLDHFLMLGVPSGQYLCFGGLSYLRVDQKFCTRLFKLSIRSVL